MTTPDPQGGTAAVLPQNGRIPHERIPEGAEPSRGNLCSWEEWFLRATPLQREEVLAHCRRQGFLFADQIPWDTAAGHRKEADSRRTRLERMFEGIVPEWEPGTSAEIAIHDVELDPFQREAVRRALGSPDVFLLEGLPGSGKSRTVAEILRQAENLGRRTLFVGRWAESLDAALELLSPDETKLRLRCSDASPRSPVLRGYSPEEVRRGVLNRLLSVARATSARTEEICRTHQATASQWDEYLQVRERRLELQRTLGGLEEGGRGVDDTVGTALDPEGSFLGTLEERQRPFEEERRGLQDELERLLSCSAEVDGGSSEAERNLTELTSQAEVLRSGRWWTPGWWGAYFRRRRLDRLGELRTQVEHHRRDVAAKGEQEQRLRDRLAHLQTAQDAQRRRLVGEEIARRRGVLQEDRDRAAAALQACDAAADRLAAALGTTGASCSADELHREWVRRRDHDQEECRLAGEWQTYLETSAEDLADKLPICAGLVAAPLDAVDADFRSRLGGGHFDLLVVEDAQTLTEAEILRLADLAPRLILVAGCERENQNLPAPAPSTPGTLQANGFTRLWHGLVGPRRTDETTWIRDNGTLRCRFIPVDDSERDRVETEHLHDNPDIALRILARPQPVLAEVAFPSGMDLAAALRFLAQELQEPALPRREGFHWIENLPGKRRVHLAVPAAADKPILVDLEDGLQASLSPRRTFYLDFHAENWDGLRTAEWIGRHLGRVDRGRAMFLGRLHRQQGPLAGWFGAVLFPHRHQEDEAPAVDGCLEIHPVPPLPRPSRARDSRRAAHGNGVQFPKEGAGLEIDLSGARSGGRIPADVFGALPRRGIANYLEGHALVRRLERLSAEEPAVCESLAVVVLQESQVVLLRRLLTNSSLLADRTIAVGLPEDFRHREFDTVFLGLTRSHSHRPVPYAAVPEDLAAALTRARRRLFLFFDPGSLVRRVAWQGPLDHLDAAAAARETDLLGRLLHRCRLSASCLASGQ